MAVEIMTNKQFEFHLRRIEVEMLVNTFMRLNRIKEEIDFALERIMSSKAYELYWDSWHYERKIQWIKRNIKY